MLRAIILLSLPAVLLACTPLPPGQEVQKIFLVQGLTELPLEFVYSTTAFPSYPTLARTSQEALKNLRSYVRTSVRNAIRKAVQQAGYSQQDQDTVAKQVNVTTFEYEPMGCMNAMDLVSFTTTTDDNTCLVNAGAVQRVAFPTSQVVDIVPNYRLFYVDLSVGNLQLSQQERDKWLQLMTEVKNQLANGKYGRFFRNTNIIFFG
ncbi:hypothetical protein Aduo_004324 [Ancylostoma duodenale]